jgi:hypothetical protein
MFSMTRGMFTVRGRESVVPRAVCMSSRGEHSVRVLNVTYFVCFLQGTVLATEADVGSVCAA